MAAITPNEKNGKVISYKFKACLGRTESGKHVFRCRTWLVPDHLPPARAERAAQKAAEKWEREVKDEYRKDLEDPERIKQREIARKRTDFMTFALETWFPLCVNDGEHKHTTVKFYRHTVNRVAQYFKGKILQSISSTDMSVFEINAGAGIESVAALPIYAISSTRPGEASSARR